MAWLNRFDDFSEIIPPPHNKGKGKNGTMQAETGRGFRQNTSMNSKVSAMSIPYADNSASFGGGFSSISDISNKKQIVSLVGLIISKEGPKTIISKKGSGVERHLVAFTLRDDPMSYINVTCWGGMDFINNLAETFRIGDVAEIKGAQVQAKSNNPTDEKFKPWTPGSFQLIVSENHSTTMIPYRGSDVCHYINLLHVPTRASNDFYTLDDIQENGMNLQGEHINILALVKKVWPVRDIVTKNGKSTSKVDVVLCDETCAAFNLTLWDNFVPLAENWTPLETVIFAADVRMTYNDYRSTMTGSTDSKTIFTIDPETVEASSLRHFSKTQSLFTTNSSPENGFSADKDPELDSITDVITALEARNLQSEMISGGSQCEYFVIYAFLSHFDIDGDDKSIFKEVCSKCGRGIQENTDYVCPNPDCNGGELSTDGTNCEYHLSINLTDHTGTLEYCYVPPQVTEQLLGYKASHFKTLPGLTKTFTKWEFLFERVKAVVKMRLSSTEKGKKCFTRVLSLEKADSTELHDKAFSSK